MGAEVCLTRAGVLRCVSSLASLVGQCGPRGPDPQAAKAAGPAALPDHPGPGKGLCGAGGSWAELVWVPWQWAVPQPSPGNNRHPGWAEQGTCSMKRVWGPWVWSRRRVGQHAGLCVPPAMTPGTLSRLAETGAVQGGAHRGAAGDLTHCSSSSPDLPWAHQSGALPQHLSQRAVAGVR